MEYLVNSSRKISFLTRFAEFLKSKTLTYILGNGRVLLYETNSKVASPALKHNDYYMYRLF
jgi:hypothetical protein